MQLVLMNGEFFYFYYYNLDFLVIIVWDNQEVFEVFNE